MKGGSKERGEGEKQWEGSGTVKGGREERGEGEEK